MLEVVKTELLSLSKPEKVAGASRFFKAEKGEYAEDDQFLGITVPEQRAVAKTHYKNISIADTIQLLQSPYHEFRLTALFILVLKFEKTKSVAEKEEVVISYLSNIAFVNNWDLVDSSAHTILGAWLWDKPKKLLYDFARSEDLWKRRISIISTFYFIRKNDFADTLAIAEILINDEQDLIHKAVGWMLREIGERDYNTEFHFLKTHYKRMPRTMLRYAIEKFYEEIRQGFLKGTI